MLLYDDKNNAVENKWDKWGEGRRQDTFLSLE